jgi:hypothetical protein
VGEGREGGGNITKKEQSPIEPSNLCMGNQADFKGLVACLHKTYRPYILSYTELNRILFLNLFLKVQFGSRKERKFCPRNTAKRDSVKKRWLR